jgi:type IV secretory pathway VirB9-like protein
MTIKRILPVSFLLLASLTTAQEWTSRTVTYDAEDIVTVATQIRFTTLVVLPETEKILDFVVGDKEFWRVEGIENFAYIKPSKAGASTNVQLITASGSVYSLVLREVSDAGGSPDLKLFIQNAAPEEPPRPPRFVSVEEANQLREALVQVAEQAEYDKEEFRREYGRDLQFVYKYKRNKKPFLVSAIYHDGRFTYIRSDALEKPSLYELAEDDGKPNLIDFHMEDGLYIVPKVLNRGRLSIGKNKLDFERVN